MRLAALLPGSFYLAEGRSTSQGIQGASDPPASPVQDMGVDHRRPDTRVTEDLLNGPDVVTAHEQMCRERVTQGVHGRVL